MKKDKIIYYVATGILSLILLFSAGLYIFQHDFVKSEYIKLGYPTYIIYPYAIAKILGVIALWNSTYKRLKEWAYAAIFFALILAFFAHYMISDGEEYMSVIAFVSLVVSYIFYRKTDGKS